MKLLNTAIIRLTLVLLAGIFTGFYISQPLSWYFLLLAGMLFILIFSYFRAKKLLLQDPLFGCSVFGFFFVLGLFSVQLQQPENQPKHYSNLITRKAPEILISISEELKPERFRKKYVAEVLKLEGAASHGKILLLLPIEATTLNLKDRLLLSAPLSPIPEPLNPQQFNYRDFMANRGILFQTSPSQMEFIKLKPADKTLKQVAEYYREDIILQLKRQNFGQEELAVIQALLLGQRRDLSRERNENFAAAGVLHILAVSGLHVGMILWLLNSLFSFFDTWPRGKYLKTLLLLLLLWAYALLAGLSPSVVRAVSMFSFVAIGMQLERRTSVLNSLCLSLIFLLLIRPHWALEVGFQLSYLAVLSIILLQPPLFNLYVPQNRVLKYFWSLGSVTLAAQAGVMPLSLYYFHQFPGLFFLSNLVVLPFLGLLLGLGFLIILLTMLELLPLALARTYNSLIKFLNQFVEWVAQQENFLFRELPLSLTQLIAFYALLLMFFLFPGSKASRKLLLLLCGFICLQGVFINEMVQKNHSELIVFHKTRHTVLGHKQNTHLKIDCDLKEQVWDQVFIKNYKLTRGITSQESAGLRNIYNWEGGWLLVIDNSSVYQVPGLFPERVLLSGSPRINLDRLLRDLRPMEIIADGSNYRSYINRWRATCQKKKIPFHYTGEKGSYILRSEPPRYSKPEWSASRFFNR